MTSNEVKDGTIWMGLREYGRHRGCSATAVAKAISKGIIAAAVDHTKKRKNINQQLADQLWPNTKRMAIDHALKNTQESEGPQEQAPSAGLNYAKSRAMKEIFAAKNEQLKYEEKAGNLCRTEDVAKAAKDMARLTRDYLLNLPDKLAPILTASTDIEEVHKILNDEIHNALTNLSKGRIF